jgi:hypothetical protein
MEGLTMLDRELPSPEYLRQRLRYDAKTGKLYWREWPANPAHWNTRYAGTEALACRHASGYLRGRLDGVQHAAHRVIWAVVHGEWPQDEIDHEDHDRANNRLNNLKAANRLGNNRNQSRRSDNTSGVTGVSWDTKRGLWYASIKIDRRTQRIGYFARFEDAVAARAAAEIKHGFHANHGAA